MTSNSKAIKKNNILDNEKSIIKLIKMNESKSKEKVIVLDS